MTTAKQARREAKKARRRQSVLESLRVWPDYEEPVPPETVCEGCGLQAEMPPNLYLQAHNLVTPCIICGHDYARYA